MLLITLPTVICYKCNYTLLAGNGDFFGSSGLAGLFAGVLRRPGVDLMNQFRP
jgi:hypothetical protein